MFMNTIVTVGLHLCHDPYFAFIYQPLHTYIQVSLIIKTNSLQCLINTCTLTIAIWSPVAITALRLHHDIGQTRVSASWSHEKYKAVPAITNPFASAGFGSATGTLGESIGVAVLTSRIGNHISCDIATAIFRLLTRCDRYQAYRKEHHVQGKNHHDQFLVNNYGNGLKSHAQNLIVTSTRAA